MLFFKRFVVFAVLALSTHQTHAFNLVLVDSGKYNTFELEKINTFIAKVTKKLPYKVKSQLVQKIELSFIDFSEGTKKYEIMPPNCEVPNKSGTEPRTAQRQSHGYSETPIFSLFNNTGKIKMNRLFLNDIFRGAQNARTYACGLKNHYLLSMSVLLHEIFHLYDHKVNFSGTGKIAEALGYDANISIGFHARNKSLERRPETYEADNLKEAAAVNFSYFLLDSEYPCRRPILNEVYAQSLNLKEIKCTKEFYVPVTANNSYKSEFVSIDLNKIYSADLLTVTPSSGLGSQVGHSMIKLVICDPVRIIMGPDCEKKDSNFHLIGAFQADVDDADIDWQKGLALWRDPYKSVLKIYTMNKVLSQYVQNEVRDIKLQKLYCTMG